MLLLMVAGASAQTYPQVDASAIYLGGPGNELTITKSGSRVTIAGAPIVVEPGSTGITTVGTIATGTWNAGAVTSSGLITTSAGLRANDGSAASPSIAFTSDPDTGISRSAADTLSVATGGVARWRVAASGHLLAETDGAYDIGASGATRPRDLYLTGTAAVGGNVYLNGDIVGGMNTTTRLRLSPNGVALLTNNNQTDFSRLQLGGTTSAFPALKRNGATLEARLADDSGYTHVAAANVTANGVLSASNVGSHWVPSQTDTYDLGSASRLWRNSFISTMNALVFARTTQTIFGGYSTIGKNAGDVAADVASAATTVNFGQTMTPGDVVLIRAHDMGGVIKAEYLQVGSLVSGTTYNVTRDLAGSHATDPAWAAGTPYLVLGQSGDGRIDLIAVDGKPRMVVTTQGSTFNAQTDRAVVGNLNTYYGYTSDIIGAAFGDPSAANITIDPTNGIRIRHGTSNKFAADASGNLTLTGDLAMGTSGVFRAGATSYASGTGWWLDYNAGTPRFRVGDPGGNQIAWDGSTLSVTGTLTSTSGTIGGWSIGASTLTSTNIALTSGAANAAHILVGTGSTAGGLNSAAASGDIAIWAGSSYANRASAPFRVTAAGDLTALSGSLTGIVTATFGRIGSRGPEQNASFEGGQFVAARFDEEDGGGTDASVVAVSGAADGQFVMRVTNQVGSHTWRLRPTFTIASSTVKVEIQIRNNGIANVWGCVAGCTPGLVAPVEVLLFDESIPDRVCNVTGGTVQPSSTWTKYTATCSGLNTSHTFSLRFFMNPYVGNIMSDFDAIVVDDGTTKGGWMVTADHIKDITGQMGLSMVASSDNDVRIWAGGTNPHTAQFRVYENGLVAIEMDTNPGLHPSRAVRFQAPDGGLSGIGGGYSPGTDGYLVAFKYVIVQSETNSPGGGGRLLLRARGRTDGNALEESWIDLNAGDLNGGDLVDPYIHTHTQELEFLADKWVLINTPELRLDVPACIGACAGALAGYITVRVQGTVVKIPVYNP